MIAGKKNCHSLQSFFLQVIRQALYINSFIIKPLNKGGAK